MDARRSADKFPSLQQWTDKALEETLSDRELDLATRGLANELYAQKTAPTCTTSKLVGNTYTAAVYMNLATLVHARGAALEDTNTMLFSYGSGSMATMFAIRARKPTGAGSVFTLQRMAETLDLTKRLAARKQCSPMEYAVHMDLRERFHGLRSVEPTQSTATLAPGTFYLVSIDDKFRRTYERTPLEEVVQANGYAAANGVAVCETKDIVKDAKLKASMDKVKAAYVAGVSAGLPGSSHSPFEGQMTLDRLLDGENCIEPLSESVKDAMLARNIVVSRKDAEGQVVQSRIESHAQGIQVAATIKPVDLEKDYGVSGRIAASMDEPTQLAVAAGLDALKNAGLTRGREDQWQLPEHMRDSTGVIYATSFPTMNAAVKEVSRFYEQGPETYELDRKVLFRLLVLAHAQLAQITGARGPNTQVNAACSGTTQAIGMAQDWITLGRCERVVVIASDVASNATLMPWIGSGFRVLGASSIAATAPEAALPFDVKRNGMIVGGGAVGMVLESPKAHAERAHWALPLPQKKPVRLLASQFTNSAYHGASLDPRHVSQELVRLLLNVERDFGITREDIAKHGVYYSHETFTNASPTASCAFTEVTALKAAFGAELLQHLVVANTKGFTGHAMAVSFEDVIAVEALRQDRVPCVANFATPDPNLPAVLRLAPGGQLQHKYALRFAAGFGSQLAFTLYALEE